MTTTPDRPTPVVDGALLAVLRSLGDRPAAPPGQSIEQRRAEADATMLLIRRPVHPSVTVTDHELAVPGGTIRLRTYQPTPPVGAAGTPLPGYLFIHGGGWAQGNLDTAEVECGPVAERVGAVVCSVEYRLAPEHPFPTPLDDCLAAWAWFVERFDDLGVDPARVAVGGTSAGGNLAAALCLAARDRGLPLPCFQWLEAPALDLALGSGSVREMGEGYGLTAADLEGYVDAYATAEQRLDPLVSPVLADDLTGLPPAAVVTAELDPVRDDGERYVARLHEAGVAAFGVRVLGHPHGTWVIPVSLTWKLVEELRTTTLREVFAGTAPLGAVDPGPGPGERG